MARDDVQETQPCPSCGTANFAYAPFCIHCGAPIDDYADEFPSTNSYVEGATTLSARGRLAGRAPGLNRILSRWEAWVGLTLLAFLLGYVAYDWQRTTTKTDAYYDGLAAVQKKDWKGAAASFERAEDHRDAPKRQQDAQEKLKERDHLYYMASVSAGQREWRTAISALERVQEIEPGFSNSADLLGHAKENLFNTGLAGAIYLVSYGPVPGLYIRDGRGQTTLLPGSDGNSTVRALAPDGSAFVYDRPKSKEESHLPPHDSSTVVGSERILVVAHLGADRGSIVALIPLPQLDWAGTGTFSAKGLWWYNSQPPNTQSGYGVSYVAWDAPGTLSVSQLSDMKRPGKRVLVVDPHRGRVVLAEEKRDQSNRVVETRLLLADARGERTTPLYTIYDEVRSGAINKDGNWLLLITQPGRGALARSVRVARLPSADVLLRQEWETRTLRRIAWSDPQEETRLSASFLPTEGGQAQVIINWVVRDSESLTLQDLDTGEYTRLWNGTPEAEYTPTLSAFTQDGDYLAIGRQAGDNAILGVAGIRPRSRLWSSAALRSVNTWIAKTHFSPEDDYVLASVQKLPSSKLPEYESIYAAHRGEEGKLTDANRLAVAYLPHDTNKPGYALPPEGSFFLYISRYNQLRAVEYSGKGDTEVAEGVSAVWSLGEKRDLSWRR